MQPRPMSETVRSFSLRIAVFLPVKVDRIEGAVQGTPSGAEEVRRSNSLRRVTDRVPPFALVLGGVTSVQVGAALARTMFDDLGPSGTSLLRLVFAALALMLLWRPDPRRYRWNELRYAVAF